MAIATADRPTAIALNRKTTNTATSKDGTTIGYQQVGKGPGLVILHGAMEWSQSHIQLAEALADKFTVYMPDRRGRGASGPYGENYSIQKEVEDIDVLLTETGAHNVFGVSSGGLIMLHAALALPAIHKIAVFEPAMIVNNSISIDFLARYDREIAEGDVVGALVTGMLGSQMGPPLFNSFPRPLLKFLTKIMISSEDKKARSGDVTMRMLAPTIHYDFQLVSESEGLLEKFKAIRADVLLLGGSKSPTYLRVALDALARLFPDAKRVEFKGAGHGATGNKNMGGQPEKVAQELREFFA